MSFGGFLETKQSGGGGGRIVVSDIPYNSNNGSNHSNDIMPSGAISLPRLATPTLTKSMFNSPGLSLALQSDIDGQGDMNRLMPENFEQNGLRRSREEEHESRSGSDNMDGGSGDDFDAADNPPRKKRYHRHTPQQIQELESLFKECPHPDEKQRLELSRRLNLETRQVKFWFQNRRTQMKTQLERHENSLLRQENDKLRAENMSMREAMRNPICSNCGGPAMIGEISLEEQHLRIENARLKDELDRVCALAGKFLGRPVSSLTSSIGPPMPNSSLELGVGSNGFGQGLSTVPSTMPDFGVGISSPLAMVSPSSTRPTTTALVTPSGFDNRSIERSIVLELALAAMDELVKMAQTGEPLWIRSLEGGREILNHEEYTRTITPCIGLRPNGFVTEASRQTGMVIINSLALVETLMDSNRWSEMFPCMIARTSTAEVISNGINGTRNGALQLMHAELQVLSPLVPVREVNFLRFCKQHAEGLWAVVDVSIDTIRETSGAPTFVNCRRLPSGCVVQDMPNGYSKVTWVEHAEYDESQIHQLFRPLLSSGMGFGAQRWVTTLQRQCECLAILMSSAAPSREHSAISSGGRRSMLKLAHRMTNNFCSGVCASTVHKWNKLNAGNVGEDVRVMTRKSVDDPGEPPGIVLSAATSVWLPVSSQRLFDFLRDERLRSEWDILSNGGPMQEMAHIAKGQDHANCVSLLRASAINANQSSMLILQETCTDASGSLVVYAPVDIPAMHVVMNGGDSAYVALLPSGFAIVPDGSGEEQGGASQQRAASGCLLTVAFQILVNSLPTAKLTVESVETVNNLISCTVQKIKSALHCES
ncbi:homeobox-leucine zipper protein ANTHOCYANINLESS 2-like [Glycine soja]|uniref:Homeobox-leucine zipper protein ANTHOCYANINLESS 2 isoform A n=2 Tax=Glycine soja TaxID=3848 RepID=A0A445FXP0_GLYSO|nr:homeobox-leucine zipper protein ANTHOCYANINLESS 2-like [Glycine soja]XP_028214623.1 homeobox-leucine zipper protein ANTHOCYANINLESS 2-like [Glycine soja]XP_028214624.1 homeobox-leucine zipper protein ANTHOCYANINLESS 2-like [Glycine soja]RZB53605.1 Homeobox-leucine zipper protein ANTHOCYANINLESS 2 isoform A [Glycine soja]RZB53606.1 Homeobox-leucine zipper protein ANTHOCYANINLESS 2 isoform B [Glycine soja]RZB53607.1 Homeobox-leucine zipper protein ANTHOCYANINLESS 2 isoform C [Glycine soja]